MRLLLLILAILATRAGGVAQKDNPAKKGAASIGDLNAEINVLQVLYSLSATKSQLDTIAKVADKTMRAAPPRRDIKVSEKYSKTLLALRDALAKGDEDAIEARFQDLDALKEKENPEFDSIEITAEARRLAPPLLRRFGVRQVANYMLGVTDFPDPVEKLIEAMEDSRKLKGDDWKDARDDAAAQVGWLIAGLDEKGEAEMKDKAGLLLDKAAKLDPKAFEKERPALIREARALLGKLGPTDVLRNYMERVLAEMLSNHRLKESVTLMGKKK